MQPRTLPIFASLTVILIAAAVLVLAPVKLSHAGSGKYLHYNKKVAKKKRTGIISVKKLYENRSLLIVDVDYIYNGEVGDRAYLHVGPSGVPPNTVAWGYQIIRLLKGRHTVSVSIGKPVQYSGYDKIYVRSTLLVVSMRSRKVDSDKKEHIESFVREVIPLTKYWQWGEKQ